MKHKKPLTIYLAIVFIAMMFVANIATTIRMVKAPQIRSERIMSLENRYPNEMVNSVFKDNILLTLSYMNDRVQDRGSVEWDKIVEPQTYSMSLEPGEVFAFHEDVLGEYKESTVKTTNAHFNYSDGFKHDGYLMGDGVCHLASLLYWAAADAGLETEVPKNHDFAVIPEVPEEYGVSIYFTPGSPGVNAQQNLYVKNTFDEPVEFVIDFDGSDLKVQVV